MLITTTGKTLDTDQPTASETRSRIRRHPRNSADSVTRTDVRFTDPDQAYRARNRTQLKPKPGLTEAQLW